MKPLRIAFVSFGSMRRYRRNASFIYRCENLGLALAANGHHVSFLQINHLLWRQDFNVVVFMRPESSWVFRHVVQRLRKRGSVLIGEVDDLIFDPEYAKFRPSVLNQTKDLERIRLSNASHAQALAQLDAIQFSTSELAAHYRRLHPLTPSVVIPNAAHHSWLNIAPLESNERSISYFSGTRTHDRDLALAEPALQRLLERHQDLTVKIVGPVTSGLQHPRVQRIEKVAFKEYVELVRRSHLCIAPLENTPFNQCKSALKAVEAATMNIPVIASPVGEYKEIHMQGLLHADSEQEWEDQLEFALAPDNYRKLSHGLRERMNAVTSSAASAQKFLAFVESVSASARKELEVA